MLPDARVGSSTRVEVHVAVTGQCFYVQAWIPFHDVPSKATPDMAVRVSNTVHTALVQFVRAWQKHK